MKKSTKGAAATATAGVLLLGGAGSLAFWSDTADVNGGSITSGTLSLTAGTCDTNWVYAQGNSKAGQPVVLFVPGDKITKKCTYTVAATGDNLKATLTAPSTVTYTAPASAASLKLTPTATFAIGTGSTTTPIADGGTITSANNGNTITATINVDIPLGTAETGSPKVNTNDTRNITATLDKLTVKVTQVQG